MKPVEQKILHDPENGKSGDCFRACVCSLLEISDDNIPNFCEFPRDEWWGKFTQWAIDNHYAVYTGTYPPKYVKNFIVTGVSPRFKDSYHSVIYQNCSNNDGRYIRLAHDPHPDGTGIKEPYIDYIWLEKIEQEA